MKKGLSKILSLACVFALLMTMAIPAFAADPAGTEADPKDPVGYEEAMKASDFEGAVIANEDASNATVYQLSEKANGKYVNTTKVALKADGTTSNDVYYAQYGVFTQENSKVRFRKLVAEKVTAADKKETYELKKNSDNKYVLGDYVTGKVAIGVDDSNNPVMFLFDDYGYLVIGNADGAAIYVDEYGDTHQYIVGDGIEDRGTVSKNPEMFYLKTTEGVVGKAYYETETGTGLAVALEGERTKSDNTTKIYQQRNDNGYIEMVTGVVTFDKSTDGYGNETKTSVRVYGWEPTTVATDYDAVQRFDGKNATKQIALALDDDKKPTDKKWYVFDKNGSVSVDDGSGNPVTKVDGKIYVLNEDGSLVVNTEKQPTKGSEKPNVWKIDGKLKDYGKDVIVSIAGVNQKFYIPASKNGDAAAVMTKDFRWTTLADGSGYEGLTYYNENGITYAGWIQDGKGSSRSLKYQTIINRAGSDPVYILVMDAQWIPEGVDPEDSTKKIEAGWYLFDENGTLVKGTKTVNLFGHKYVLNNDKIVSIDGTATKPM